MVRLRLFGGRHEDAGEYQRLEARLRTLAEAREQWLALLRDMERQGETADARYETYYQAYVKARQQEKRVDLELFNLRKGLTT